jgi:antibiotic biosynthesis monooxygenase (ABM) superfamily enzyme
MDGTAEALKGGRTSSLWAPRFQQRGKSMRTIADHRPNPPKYKSVVALTLGLYPLVVVGNLWVATYLEFLPLLVRLLVMTATYVTLMTYVVMPLVTRLLRGWFFRSNDPQETSHVSNCS